MPTFEAGQQSWGVLIWKSSIIIPQTLKVGGGPTTKKMEVGAYDSGLQSNS